MLSAPGETGFISVSMQRFGLDLELLLCSVDVVACGKNMLGYLDF